VPVAPPGVDINENVQAGEHHMWNYKWLYDQFHTGGPQDYKNLGHLPGQKSSSKYDPFGNFNFGAVLAATGVPLWQGIAGGEYDHKHVWGKPSSPNDKGNDEIVKGYNWYSEYYLWHHWQNTGWQPYHYW
jgi:hypothetical protein